MREEGGWVGRWEESGTAGGHFSGREEREGLRNQLIDTAPQLAAGNKLFLLLFTTTI